MSDFRLELLKPRHWLTWLGVGLLLILAWLPWKARSWLAMYIGQALYQHHHKRRRVVLNNLRLCFPHLTESERAQWALGHFREYAYALLNYSVMFFRPRRWLQQQIQIQGREQLDAAIAAGQNIVLMLGHSVWLEIAPIALGEHYRIYGSYKPFRNAVIDWLIARSRLKDVEFVVARQEGMMKLVRSLEPGRIMIFLPDEDHGLKASVFAPFFGLPKATLTTPARLCKLGKAVAFPVMAFREPNSERYSVEIGPALTDFPHKEEAVSAASLNAGLAELIKQHPHQYLWMLKFFRTRPLGETSVY